MTVHQLEDGLVLILLLTLVSISATSCGDCKDWPLETCLNVTIGFEERTLADFASIEGCELQPKGDDCDYMPGHNIGFVRLGAMSDRDFAGFKVALNKRAQNDLFRFDAPTYDGWRRNHPWSAPVSWPVDLKSNATYLTSYRNRGSITLFRMEDGRVFILTSRSEGGE